MRPLSDVVEGAQQQCQRRTELVADVGQERGLRGVQGGQRLEPGLLPGALGGDGEDLAHLVGHQGREPLVVVVEGPQRVRAEDQHRSWLVLHAHRERTRAAAASVVVRAGWPLDTASPPAQARVTGWSGSVTTSGQQVVDTRADRPRRARARARRARRHRPGGRARHPGAPRPLRRAPAGRATTAVVGIGCLVAGAGQVVEDGEPACRHHLVGRHRRARPARRPVPVSSGTWL